MLQATVWFFILCSFSCNTVVFSTNFTNFNQVNIQEFNEVAESGVVGVLSSILHGAFENETFSALVRRKKCTAIPQNIGHLQFYYSQRPRGKCSYCCSENLEKHITLFWTNKNLGKLIKLPSKLKAGALSFRKFDSNLSTVVYIHGMSQDGLGQHVKLLNEAYFSRSEDYNLIYVDWKDLCTFPWYVSAKNNTKIVADVVSNFLNFYAKTGELRVSKLHIIGFSLGAHVAGIIGKKVKNIPRITGLDPGLPLYKLEDTSDRLFITDANYIDVIHTFSGVISIHISIGHADFYPNFLNKDQPGCTAEYLYESNSLELFGSCNHFRAMEFYAESVRNPKAFPATRCNLNDKIMATNCSFHVDAYMGFSANKKTINGDYYLLTNEKSPFGKSIYEQKAAIYQHFLNT